MYRAPRRGWRAPSAFVGASGQREQVSGLKASERMDREMQERRIAPRVTVSWPVFVRDHMVGNTFNVSASGVLFLSNNRMSVGAEVELQIRVAANSIVHCIVRIVREAPTSKSHCYAYAGEFTEFRGNDGWVIKNVIRRMLMQQKQQRVTVEHAQSRQADAARGVDETDPRFAYVAC